jgi:hypothetical protein
MTPEEMVGAEISDCGLYRYRLWRRWGSGAHVLWIMLNPSTADGMTDDPTIRRCVGFARDWSYDGIRVVNLVAYRATDPKDMWGKEEIFTATNYSVLEQEMGAEKCGAIVVGWGASGRRVFGAALLYQLERDVVDLTHRSLRCFGVTKHGHPLHPLYVPKVAQLIPWRPKETH